MPKQLPEQKRLIVAFDCTQEYPSDRYFAGGEARVVETAAGRYREAEGKPMSRFGYRFSVANEGRPHLAVIRYPDDKRRYMCVMDGTCYDLTTGVFTGWAQPPSGRMLEIEQLFWPRWNDCSIVFMTWGEGEPAAVASVEIHELDDLPALAVPDDPGGGSRRELGIQYEDPCGTASSEGALDREEWMDRVIAYARHTGQKLLVYPLAWYHGPLFPSQREPSGALEGVVARDRKQYLRWTSHPEDWYARLLERFADAGLEFQGSLTLMRLGSLMERMNCDLDAIRAGADTINNMLWNDRVQAGTGDWTPFYNVRNFTAIAARLGEGQRGSPFAPDLLPQWAYGEKSGPYHAGPIFNPLHPVVQEAVLGLASEIAQRYAPYPAFKGISFNFFPSTMLWFGSLHSGYDDYTIRLFELETGIRVPMDPTGSDRFSRRYAFLTHVCRPAWVAWRCRKVRNLIRSIRDEVRTRRSDLRVALTLWDETVVPGVLGEVGGGHQVGARLSNGALYREAGLDLDLYRNEPGIEVDLGMGNARDRGGHGPMPAGGANRPLEAMNMFRDHDFLERETLDAARAQQRPAVFIFNCWVEAWGEHVWWRPGADDTNVARLAVMDGKPAEGILRANSEYPPDGFWWDSQSRIVPAFPGGPHFMEPYAHALAELDACRITRGGLFLDKAHSEPIRRFAQAFRALPHERFDTVGTNTDPVAMRALARDGVRYFYLVNREYYPIEVEVAFSRSPREAHDLTTRRTVRAAKRWRVILGPYELRTFTIAPEIEIAGFQPHPPEDIVRSLTEEGEAVLRDVGRVRAAGQFIPWMDELEQGMRSAIAEGRLAWLRRALTGYTARKCREVAAAD